MKTKKEFDEEVANILKTKTIYACDIFSRHFEFIMNELGISYRRGFPEINTMCVYYIAHPKKEFMVILDTDTFKVVFDINAGSPIMSIDAFSYGEFFGKGSFKKAYDMMVQIIDNDIYYK